MAKLILPTNSGNGLQTSAGALLPDSALRQERVAEWVSGLSQFRPAHPAEPYSAHLDELLGHPVTPAEYVGLSCRVLEELVAQTVRAGLEDTCLPALRIALIDTEDFVTEAPADLSALQSALRVVEPPSLYLIRRALLSHLWARECYTRPLPFALFPNNSGIYCFYETFRTPEDMANGWEYARHIGADYYPEALR